MKKVLISVLAVVLVVLIGAGAYVYNLLDRIPKGSLLDPEGNKIEDDSQGKKEALGIGDKAPSQKDSGITNILLFGLDKRSEKESGHSDAIMIASIDRNSKKIKLTSLMRDMYVDIPGKKSNRINTAYFSGGASLAIRTINTNFDMNVEDYISVDFYALEDIIDLVGGVDIDVSKSEVKYINQYIDETNKIEGKFGREKKKVNHVSKSGLQTLNGRQAVAYCRNRYSGRDDFERTERQRRVMNLLMQKGMDISITKIPELVNTVLPSVETSLTKTEIVGLATTILGFGKQDIEQFRIPTDDGFQDKNVDGMLVLVPDLELNTERLHEFIYGSKSSYASDNKTKTEDINQ